MEKLSIDKDEKRTLLQSVEIHHVAESYDDYENYYFPMNHSQVRDILGQILTQIESMNLSPKSEKANKAIFTQMVWRWFDEVMDNSATSYEPAGLRPIKVAREETGGVDQPPAVIVEDK
jgi:hypothetical protein